MRAPHGPGGWWEEWLRSSALVLGLAVSVWVSVLPGCAEPETGGVATSSEAVAPGAPTREEGAREGGREGARESARESGRAEPGSTSPSRPGSPGDWITYGGDPGQTRHSPLAEIDTGNVADLVPAWNQRTGVPGIFESTPLAVDGALYVTTPGRGGEQRVIRLDGATGESVWETTLSLGTVRVHPTAANRGAAYLDGRLYVGTLDARLVALDAATGEVLWARRTADPEAGYSHKQAPLAHEDLVVIGAGTSPYGIRGHVKAFDAETGEERWTWHAIPSPEEGGWWGEWRERAPGTGLDLGRDLAAERGDSTRYAGAWRRGGGAVWMTPTLDPERELLYVGVGNPAPELDGARRPGDNRWTVSVCAIAFRSGRTEWCRQYIPHDVWGLDAASPPILFPMPDGTPAVGHFSKLGVFFAWDRRRGDSLVTSEPYVPHRNPLVPPSPEGTEMAPGIYGGTEWSPAAYSPLTGWLYAANVHKPGRYVVRRTPEGRRVVNFDDLPGDEEWGNVVAVDPRSGGVVWETRTPLPMVGGVLSTAGGLVFAGRLDGALDAYHARTGERLWSGSVDYGCASAPMTYRAGVGVGGTSAAGRPAAESPGSAAEGGSVTGRGSAEARRAVGPRQFVAVACGGHFLGGRRRGDVLVVFALPEAGAE